MTAILPILVVISREDEVLIGREGADVDLLDVDGEVVLGVLHCCLDGLRHIDARIHHEDLIDCAFLTWRDVGNIQVHGALGNVSGARVNHGDVSTEELVLEHRVVLDGDVVTDDVDDAVAFFAVGVEPRAHDSVIAAFGGKRRQIDGFDLVIDPGSAPERFVQDIDEVIIKEERGARRVDPIGEHHLSHPADGGDGWQDELVVPGLNLRWAHQDVREPEVFEVVHHGIRRGRIVQHRIDHLIGVEDMIGSIEHHDDFVVIIELVLGEQTVGFLLLIAFAEDAIGDFGRAVCDKGIEAIVADGTKHGSGLLWVNLIEVVEVRILDLEIHPDVFGGIHDGAIDRVGYNDTELHVGEHAFVVLFLDGKVAQVGVINHVGLFESRNDDLKLGHLVFDGIQTDVFHIHKGNHRLSDIVERLPRCRWYLIPGEKEDGDWYETGIRCTINVHRVRADFDMGCHGNNGFYVRCLDHITPRAHYDERIG